MKLESPRGPITIDPQTRDIVENVYLRRIEKRDGKPINIEFATIQWSATRTSTRKIGGR